MHGPEGVRFYTRLKTITTRWPTGMRAEAEFVMPTMGSFAAFAIGHPPTALKRPDEPLRWRYKW